MKTIKTCSLLLVATLLAGCAGIAPMPSCSLSRVGQAVTKPQATFIRVNETTREEVIATLGTNYLALPNNETIAYSWEKPGMDIGWYGVFVWFAPYTAGEVHKKFTDHAVVHGWHAFFIHFDDNNKVTATAFKSLSDHISLHQHMDKWEQRIARK